MGWATVRTGSRFSYTGELKVRFRQPVPLQSDLQVRARVKRHTRLIDFAFSELRDAEKRILATAEGKFVLLDPRESAKIADALIYSSDSWRPSQG